MSTTFLPSLTDDAIAFLDDMALSIADRKADAEYNRRERAEAAMLSAEGFDDLLEELTATNGDIKRDFMVWLASGDRTSCSCLFVELSRAVDRIVTRRLAQGE